MLLLMIIPTVIMLITRMSLLKANYWPNRLFSGCSLIQVAVWEQALTLLTHSPAWQFFLKIHHPLFLAHKPAHRSHTPLALDCKKTSPNTGRQGLVMSLPIWGGQLGLASEQTLNNGLSLSHLYTNSLMFGLSYVA